MKTITLALMLACACAAQYHPAGSGGGSDSISGTSLNIVENFMGGQLGTNSNIFAQSATYSQQGTPVISFPAPDLTHSAGIGLGTSGTSADNIALIFGLNSTNLPQALGGLSVLPSGASWEAVGVFRLTAVTAEAFKFCLISAAGTVQFTDTFNNGFCARFSTSASDTTWKLETCSGSVCTVTDTLVTVAAATWYKLRIYSTVSGTIALDVTPSGGSKTTVSTTSNIATAKLGLEVMLQTKAAAQKNVDISAPLYFDIQGLSRP